MASNPFALLTEPSTAFAPPEQDKAPANPFEGLAAYSTAPDKVPRGTKIPGSVAGTEPIRWITIGGHPVPIKAPSGADHMLPVPGNTNVLQDPQTKEHYFKTPGPNGEFKSIWDTQRKVAKDGKIISHVKGVGDHEWGDDPKVAERAQKKQEATDKKEQKDVTATAAADTKEVLQQAAIPVTVAKETLAHQDKVFSAQVAKAQTNKKLSAGVVTSTQDKANEAFAALKTHVETNHDPAAGKFQGNDEDFVPRFKKLKLSEGTSEDQYKSKEGELRKQYKDAQTTANAAKRVDDENKRFVATAYFHKQAWLDQSKPLREGLKQTTIGLKSFKDQKLLTEGTTSRLQANEEQVRTSWPLKTNTGRNADGSARPPQITTPPDFNQYNPEAPQPTPAQTQAAGRDVIAEHMDISGLPPMPRVGIQPRTLGSSFLPLNGPKLATPTKDGEVPDLTGEPEDSLKESRASVLKGLQNANRGMAYNVPDKPITWDKDTLQHDGQPVGKIQRDEFGAPALYIDHGHDGQKVSPSLNSGHYYDGIPELSSPSPAHLDEFKASGVTKPEDVQKAWGQRRWSTSDLNDLVDQWTSSNDDERQDLIAQTNPSQANVTKGQRRLNTRELYKEGMISAQDARMLDHAFYGRKPGVEDPSQSFEQFKQSEHPDAKALASFAHDNTTLNPIAAGASQDAYGRALTSWSADYLKRNATSPDFDRREFIAARDKLLQPLGQRASAWVGKTAQGLAGIVPALVEQPVNVGLGLAKTAGELALEKAGVNPQNVKDLAGAFGADQVADVAGEVGIHAHSPEERELVRQGSQGFGNSFASFMGDHLNYEVLKAAVTNLFSPVNPSEANAATVWEGKNGSKVKATTKELFDSIDSESMTPAKLKELSVKLRDASIELHGIKNFDATNTTGYDYNGRYDVSDPRSPLAQALAGYAETADPSYKEMFKQALSTSEGGDALAQKMSEYLQAHGHIAGTPVGAAMSWLNRLSGGALHYDNPDAWRTLSESAGNTVQPLQVMAIQELLGATSALPGILKGAAAPIVKSTGRALLASGELANGASSVAKAMQKISTIPLDTAAQSAGSTFAKQLGTSAMHGAGFMALQQPGMGIGQSIGDVTQAGAEGAGIGMVAGAFNAASKALDIRRTNAAQNQAHADFVSHWNESFPQNPITIADSRQASHYMGPEEAPRLQQIRTLADQFQAIKDKVSARTATREEFEQLKPLRLQLDNLFVAQQHAMDGAVAATQEINGITDPNLKGWANAALKQLSGNPLTPVEEAAMTSAVTENGLPLSTPNGDGTHTITDAGLATMEQVAPATRRAYFPSDETSQFTTPNENSTPTSSPPPEQPPVEPAGIDQGRDPVIPRQSPEEVRMGEGETGRTQGTEVPGRPEESQPVAADTLPEQGALPTDGSVLGREPEVSGTDRTGAREQPVEAPPETVNPAPSSPEPATQADPARAESDTEPVTHEPETEAQALASGHKLVDDTQAAHTLPKFWNTVGAIAKKIPGLAAVLGGEEIVRGDNTHRGTGWILQNMGLPTGFTDRYGKFFNWGTQWYDKVKPGSDLGQWMDGLKRANPEIHKYLGRMAHEHGTGNELHRMWFGHDPLANFGAIVDKFGWNALPEYAQQLFKDNLTHEGIPLPGAQWLWEKGIFPRTEATADWMSMNIGEDVSAGVALYGTARLFQKLKNGQQIHDGWALTGAMTKLVGGLVQSNPILILTSAADVAIVAAANTKSIAKAFRLRAERRAALDKAIEPTEKKLQGFKPQTTTSNERPTEDFRGPVLPDKGQGNLSGDIRPADQQGDGSPIEPEQTGGGIATPAGEGTGGPQQASGPDYRGIARDQIAEQLKDSPALRDLVEVHEEVPEDMQDAGGMALTRKGGIRVALPQLEEQLQGMTPEEARSHVAKVLDEEVRHVAHVQAARMLYDQKKAAGETGKLGFGQWMQEHYGKMWAEFSPEQQQAVRDAYGKTLDAQPDANKAMEALRIISQRRATGDQSETSMLWQKLPQSVLEHLKAVFDYLKNLSKQKLTPALEQELSGIEQVLKEHNYGQKEAPSEPIDTSNAAEHADALERAADHIEGIGGKHHVGTLRAHAEELRAHAEEEAQNHPAMVELRKSNEELPAAAQKLWTHEVYTKAADFYKTGDVKALDGLTVIQKRRITAAGVNSSPEAMAKRMRATTESIIQKANVAKEHVAANIEDALVKLSPEVKDALINESGFDPSTHGTLQSHLVDSFSQWLVDGRKSIGELGKFFTALYKKIRTTLVGVAAFHLGTSDFQSGEIKRVETANVPSVESKAKTFPRGDMEMPKVDFGKLPKPEEIKPQTVGGKIGTSGLPPRIEVPHVASSVVEWVKNSKDNKGYPFIVADKPGGKLLVFDAEGNLKHSSPALFGKDKGDFLKDSPGASLEGKQTGQKITPAGRFGADVVSSEAYGKALHFKEEDKYALAIHKVYLGTPAEKRSERLRSTNPEDHRVSYGCINVGSEVMDQHILPLFEKHGGVVYVLPETESGAKLFQNVDAKQPMLATTEDPLQAAPIKRTPEEIAEMMKGLPAEERAKIALDNNLTAPKNAVTEEMQSRLNMPATQKIAALKETEVDALARRKLATNPDAPRAILNDFNQSGKAMSAADVRVLGKESGRIYSRLKEIEDLRGKASPEERAAMAAESRELRPYLDELYQAISHTGTLSSDALRSRKYLEELNHSEAGIKQALRNAFGGRDLTPEEEATVAKEAEEISKAYIAVERQKAIEDAPKVSAALQRAVHSASQPINAPSERSVSGAALKQIKSRAAKARELLAKSAMEPAQSAPLKSAPIKLSTEKLAAYADIAAEHLLEGRNISDELVKEYPDSRAHLSEIITEAKKVHAAILVEAAKAEQAKATKAAAKLDPKNIMTAAKAGEYGDEISPQWMHELAMAHIVDAHKDGGTPTETDIIKRMVKDVKTLFPDAGEREVREALVEYGKINKPNPEQMASELRQLKRISRLVLSKEDATEGKAPPKSQIRDKQSPEERQMRRELSRIMDEHNVERQDPERALASRRDRLKSSLNNQIEDLQRIIDSKAKPERKLSPVVDDAEIKQLKARKQALVDQVNAMDSVKTATEAQRVETAIKAAKASQMEWERKLRDQEILAKKTKTPEANAAVIEARKQRDAAREAYADMVDAKDMHLPGALFKEAERKLEAAKKHEAEIRDKIINGDTSSPEKKPAFTTPELEAQKGVNAELNKQLAKMRSEVEKAQRVADKARQANLPGDLFKRAETQLKAAQKREAELQDKLAKGDLAVKKITGQFKTPELEQAQARVKALNDQMAKLRREAPRTAEQEAKAREVYLRQNDARIAEIERKIREQDFAPKAKKEFPHDDPTTKSKVMLGKANERLQSAIKAKELADRSRFRRGMDATVHVLREIKLANLVTSGEKLGGAALENVLTRPLSQLAAATTQIPRMVGVTFLNDIRRKATYEGSLNQNAELRALRRMGSAEGLKAVWDKVRHGKSDLDWMHKDPHFTEEMTSYFGRVHGMIKEPVRQGIYSRSMKIRSDIAAKMGIDFKTDEIAANEASARAYEDANREIFMGDNILTSGVRKMLNHWRNDKKNPGASKLMADAFEVLLPIINVPTNLAGRGMLLNPLVGFTKATWGIMKAFNNGELKNGAETLSEKDAEIIMRAYKYGMLGTAAALYAWNNPQHFGGIYTGISHPGGNDDKTLKAGDIHIPGTSITINHHLAHGPLGTHLNVVADARREYDRILEKTGKKTDAALDAMAFLTMAPVRQLPYVQAILRAADPIKSLGQNAGSLVRDSLYGTAFTNYYDTRNGKPVKRSPRDFKEELMLGIPGLRQQVPESKSQEKADAAATTTASPFSGLPRPSRRPQTHRRPHR